jgi:hypothetical protein
MEEEEAEAPVPEKEGCHATPIHLLTLSFINIKLK